MLARSTLTVGALLLMLLVLQVGGWWKVRLSKVAPAAAAACVPDTLDGIVHSRNCRQESGEIHASSDTVCLVWLLVFGCINCRHGNSVG